MTEKMNNARRAHDPFFRWLFADVKRLRLLLGLAGKVDHFDFLQRTRELESAQES